MQRTAVGSAGTLHMMDECDAKQLSVGCCMLNRVIILPASAKKSNFFRCVAGITIAINNPTNQRRNAPRNGSAV